MMTDIRRESATIYEFPRKFRMTTGARREIGRARADLQVQQIATVECGSGWYHDAAIQDAQRTPKP